MFYCGECRLKNEWPGLIPTSHGRCEMCGLTRPCFDRPSSMLPPVKPQPPDPQTFADVLAPAFREEIIYCYSCGNENNWPESDEVRKAKCEECKIVQPCFVLDKDDLPEPKQATVKLYANESSGEDYFHYPDQWKKENKLTKRQYEAAKRLCDDRPLYEVEFQYELPSRECVAIIHDGKRWVPEDTFSL